MLCTECMNLMQAPAVASPWRATLPPRRVPQSTPVYCCCWCCCHFRCRTKIIFRVTPVQIRSFGVPACIYSIKMRGVETYLDYACFSSLHSPRIPDFDTSHCCSTYHEPSCLPSACSTRNVRVAVGVVLLSLLRQMQRQVSVRRRQQLGDVRVMHRKVRAEACRVLNVLRGRGGGVRVRGGVIA